MIHRRIRAAILGILGGVVFVACNKSSGESNASTGAEPMRVALLSPGPVNDNGWNAGAYDGLLAIEKELGAVKSQQQVRSNLEIEEGFRRNAQKGAKLIFGHGLEFGDSAMAIGKEFPKCAFVVSAGAREVVAENVASMVWRIEDSAYVCGRVAAHISKTGKAGCVGGKDIPPVRSAFEAFADGAKSVRADFTVRQAYLNSWDDIGAARAQAQALIQDGCDCLFHDADAAGLGMLDAAAKAGIYAFGCTKDQSSSAPDAVVASAVIDVPKSFLLVAREVKENRFKGRRVEWTRRDGVIGFVWNEKLKSKLPPEFVRDADELDAKIAKGEVKVQYHSP
ncbi:MAG: BMP family protein [Planctomycetes bacterium]|nr:BMP family protein [Planctomycetota bacterium]